MSLLQSNFLRAAALSLGVSLPCSQALSETSSAYERIMSYQSSQIDSGTTTCFPAIDMSSYLEPYVVRPGDTL